MAFFFDGLFLSLQRKEIIDVFFLAPIISQQQKIVGVITLFYDL